MLRISICWRLTCLQRFFTVFLFVFFLVVTTQYSNVRLSNVILIYNRYIFSINGHKCIGFCFNRGLSSIHSCKLCKYPYRLLLVYYFQCSNYSSLTMFCLINIQVLFSLFLCIEPKNNMHCGWCNKNNSIRIHISS